MLALDSAIEFRFKKGDQEIMEYNQRLCREAAEYLTQRWNTSIIAPWDVMRSMVNIRLPCNTKEPICWTYSTETLEVKHVKIRIE